jgi:hypothetical protein
MRSDLTTNASFTPMSYLRRSFVFEAPELAPIAVVRADSWTGDHLWTGSRSSTKFSRDIAHLRVRLDVDVDADLALRVDDHEVDAARGEFRKRRATDDDDVEVARLQLRRAQGARVERVEDDAVVAVVEPAPRDPDVERVRIAVPEPDAHGAIQRVDDGAPGDEPSEDDDAQHFLKAWTTS